MKKKLLSVMLAITMCIAFIQCIAFATTEQVAASQTESQAMAANTVSTPVIVVKARAIGKKGVKLSWIVSGGAKGPFEVFAGKNKKKLKKIATTSKKSIAIKKMGKRAKLKNKTVYRFYIKGKNAKTATISFIIGGKKGKFGNPLKLGATLSKNTIAVGESVQIKSTTQYKKKLKSLGKKPVMSYFTDNETIATVNKKGLITGVNKGTTYIFVQHFGGRFAKLKIVVTEPKPIIVVKNLAKDIEAAIIEIENVKNEIYDDSDDVIKKEIDLIINNAKNDLENADSVEEIEKIVDDAKKDIGNLKELADAKKENKKVIDEVVIAVIETTLENRATNEQKTVFGKFADAAKKAIDQAADMETINVASDIGKAQINGAAQIYKEYNDKYADSDDANKKLIDDIVEDGLAKITAAKTMEKIEKSVSDVIVAIENIKIASAIQKGITYYETIKAPEYSQAEITKALEKKTELEAIDVTTTDITSIESMILTGAKEIVKAGFEALEINENVVGDEKAAVTSAKRDITTATTKIDIDKARQNGINALKTAAELYLLAIENDDTNTYTVDEKAMAKASKEAISDAKNPEAVEQARFTGEKAVAKVEFKKMLNGKKEEDILADGSKATVIEKFAAMVIKEIEESKTSTVVQTAKTIAEIKIAGLKTVADEFEKYSIEGDVTDGAKIANTIKEQAQDDIVIVDQYK
ncbi:MAG: Ig-like domain-containing protein, partial [Alphaproteobacteria bacterium]|nr:Ig-like domain-containing protein [Alphaproteobacteria bacterium]